MFYKIEHWERRSDTPDGARRGRDAMKIGREAVATSFAAIQAGSHPNTSFPAIAQGQVRGNRVEVAPIGETVRRRDLD
jgi:hypothetical protein